MEIYIRYEFLEKPDFTYLREQGHDVVDSLQPFVIQEAVLNDEGEIIQDAVYSDKFPVDIIYIDAEPDESLEACRVTPVTPKHRILGK